MSKIARGVTLAFILLIWAAPAAFSLGKTVNVSAIVDGTLTMTVKLFENDITGTDITAGNIMDFKTLTDIGTGTLRSSSPGAVMALVSVNNHSLKWKLEQTGTAATSGSDTLPSGATVVTPVYVDGDNGGTANDGTLGSAGSWVATSKALFTSAANGKIRTIRGYYAITDDPAAGSTAGVPLDQPAGTYTCTVTFTATSLV